MGAFFREFNHRTATFFIFVHSLNQLKQNGNADIREDVNWQNNYIGRRA